MLTLKRPAFVVGLAVSSMLLLTPLQASAASTSSSPHIASPIAQEARVDPQVCPPTIGNGSTGTWVRTLQSALNNDGYGPLLVDGIFGMRTGSAVGQFQRDHGLNDDEIVGPLTWHALGYC